MKFSYGLIKKFYPGAGSVAKVVDDLTMKLFEVDGVEGQVLDIKILPNRWSDAASYLGIAAELAAIGGKKIDWPEGELKWGATSPNLQVTVKEKKLCYRYAAAVGEVKDNGESPEYIKEVLIGGGLRPIRMVVDIMT